VAELAVQLAKFSVLAAGKFGMPSPYCRAGNREKSLFDAIVYESEVEKEFARDLDSNENVKLFVKLPSWFKIESLLVLTTRIGRLSQNAKKNSTLCAKQRVLWTMKTVALRRTKRSPAVGSTSTRWASITMW
jgi:hypothetical protein